MHQMQMQNAKEEMLHFNGKAVTIYNERYDKNKLKKEIKDKFFSFKHIPHAIEDSETMRKIMEKKKI